MDPGVIAAGLPAPGFWTGALVMLRLGRQESPLRASPNTPPALPEVIGLSAQCPLNGQNTAFIIEGGRLFKIGGGPYLCLN